MEGQGTRDHHHGESQPPQQQMQGGGDAELKGWSSESVDKLGLAVLGL